MSLVLSFPSDFGLLTPEFSLSSVPQPPNTGRAVSSRLPRPTARGYLTLRQCLTFLQPTALVTTQEFANAQRLFSGLSTPVSASEIPESVQSRRPILQFPYSQSRPS